MGQKANPNSLRYGVNKDWQSRSIAEDKKQFAKSSVQDQTIRQLLIKKYKDAQISNVEIGRQHTNLAVFIYSSQPGVLFRKEGANPEKLKKESSLILGRKIQVTTKIITSEHPHSSARFVAREIADAIEKKVSFRNAQKMSIKKVLASGALGVKTKVSGSLQNMTKSS